MKKPAVTVTFVHDPAGRPVQVLLRQSFALFAKRRLEQGPREGGPCSGA